MVAALLMNDALRLYSSTDIDGGQTDDPPEWARHPIALHRRGVGLGARRHVRDRGQLPARRARRRSASASTSSARVTFRATSFQCFVASLVSFTISFPLSLFYKTKGSARWLILGAGALITIMMVKDWITILGLANAIVYKARASLGT